MNQRLLRRVAFATLPVYGIGVAYDALAAAGVVPEQPVDLTPPAVFSATSGTSVTASVIYTIVSPVTGEEIKVIPQQALSGRLTSTLD